MCFKAAYFLHHGWIFACSAVLNNFFEGCVVGWDAAHLPPVKIEQILALRASEHDVNVVNSANGCDACLEFFVFVIAASTFYCGCTDNLSLHAVYVEFSLSANCRCCAYDEFVSHLVAEINVFQQDVFAVVHVGNNDVFDASLHGFQTVAPSHRLGFDFAERIECSDWLDLNILEVRRFDDCSVGII